MERNDIIELLHGIKSALELPVFPLRDAITSYQWRVLKPVATFINNQFCDCRYVEYWMADCAFGSRFPLTEMGAELKDCTTIEKFVDFLYTLQHDKVR